MVLVDKSKVRNGHFSNIKKRRKKREEESLQKKVGRMKQILLELMRDYCLVNMLVMTDA